MDVYKISILIPRITSLAYMFVMLAWIFLAEGGLGTTFTTVFGWHALMMSIAMILLQESILTPRNSIWKICGSRVNSSTVKWVHVVLNVTVLVSIAGGIAAIVQYKNLSPQPVVYPFY